MAPSDAEAGRLDRKARTRAAILAAARDLFVRQGFDGTTIRDVASAAGVGLGTVHAHFADKTALLLACFQEQLTGAVALALETLDADAPLLDQLTHLGRVLYAAYARHPALSRVMFQASLWPSSDPEAPPAEDALLAEFLAEVVALFQAARRKGSIERLPGDGMLCAQGFFAAYMATLVGGLAGMFGPPGAPGAADRWAAALRSLLALQLVGLGASPSLLEAPAESAAQELK